METFGNNIQRNELVLPLLQQSELLQYRNIYL